MALGCAIGVLFSLNRQWLSISKVLVAIASAIIVDNAKFTNSPDNFAEERYLITYIRALRTLERIGLGTRWWRVAQTKVVICETAMNRLRRRRRGYHVIRILLNWWRHFARVWVSLYRGRYVLFSNHFLIHNWRGRRSSWSKRFNNTVVILWEINYKFLNCIFAQNLSLSFNFVRKLKHIFFYGKRYS